MLLLTKTTKEFRATYPELIVKWDRELGNGNCNPDLHFCLYTIEEYPNLEAHLRATDYRFDFALNAYIIHSKLQQDFVFIGHTSNEAVELANKELKAIYRVLDSEPLDDKSKLFKGINEGDLKE